MRGNGWTDIPVEELEEGLTGDKLKKRNARIDNSRIKELSEKLKRNFEEEDENSLLSLPVIIRLANTLYGKSYSVK